MYFVEESPEKRAKAQRFFFAGLLRRCRNILSVEQREQLFKAFTEKQDFIKENAGKDVETQLDNLYKEFYQFVLLVENSHHLEIQSSFHEPIQEFIQSKPLDAFKFLNDMQATLKKTAETKDDVSIDAKLYNINSALTTVGKVTPPYALKDLSIIDKLNELDQPKQPSQFPNYKISADPKRPAHTEFLSDKSEETESERVEIIKNAISKYYEENPSHLGLLTYDRDYYFRTFSNAYKGDPTDGFKVAQNAFDIFKQQAKRFITEGKTLDLTTLFSSEEFIAECQTMKPPRSKKYIMDNPFAMPPADEKHSPPKQRPSKEQIGWGENLKLKFTDDDKPLLQKNSELKELFKKFDLELEKYKDQKQSATKPAKVDAIIKYSTNMKILIAKYDGKNDTAQLTEFKHHSIAEAIALYVEIRKTENYIQNGKLAKGFQEILEDKFGIKLPRHVDKDMTKDKLCAEIEKENPKMDKQLLDIIKNRLLEDPKLTATAPRPSPFH